MQIQKEVGEDYGLYFALLNSTLILNIILDFGISNYNNRKVSINNNRFSRYFKNILIIRLLLSVLYLFILQLWGVLGGYSGNEKWMLFLLGLTQVFLSSILYIRSNFTAFGRFKLDSLFSVLDRLFMIGGVLYLLVNKGDYGVTIKNFIYVQVLGYGISFIIGLFTLLLLGRPGLPKLEKRFAKMLLIKSAPYALIVILMAAYHSVDSVMIERILSDGKQEASYYAQGMRILMALNNYAYLFAVLLLPMFSKILAKKERVQSLISTSSALLIYGVSSLSILLAYYSEDVIALCYGKFNGGEYFINSELNIDAVTNMDDIYYSSDIFKLLIFGIIPMSINYCFGTLITASGNMKLLNKIAASSLTLNVILNLVLIPSYGAYGAAFASLITQSFSGVFQIGFAVKLFHLDLRIMGLIRFFLGIVFLLFSILLINELTLVLRLFSLLVCLLIGLLISVDLKGAASIAKGFRSNA